MPEGIRPGCAIHEARAVAAVAEQLWIATHDDQLARVDLAGQPLGPVRSLPFAARAVLQPGALWAGRGGLVIEPGARDDR